jgi:predicted SAM-dependent methyltransferase
MIPRADWPQRLNLGCGKRPLPEAINHDRQFFFAHVDHAWDLNHFPWPWPDGSFREVIAEDVLEHLDDVVGFMDECWRILSPGGRLRLCVPHYQSENVAIDPTHRRGFHPRSFEYFTQEGFGQTYHYTDRRWRVVQQSETDGTAHNLVFILEKL